MFSRPFLLLLARAVASPFAIGVTSAMAQPGQQPPPTTRVPTPAPAPNTTYPAPAPNTTYPAPAPNTTYPAPAPAPYPRSGYPAPAPYGYGYPQQNRYSLLTPEERELLLQGEINGGQVALGALVSGWLGFGIGHAVQGRYADVGWKFTIGEVATLGGFFVGLSMALEDDLNSTRDQDDSGETIMVVSLIGYGVLRVWEFIDTIAGPSVHNRKVRAAKWKAYGGQPPPRYGFFVAPTNTAGNGGGVAGLSMRF